MKGHRHSLGDFQTPLPLAKKVCHYLREKEIDPQIVVEPTCGKGNFVVAAVETFPSLEKVYAIEIQQSYRDEFLKNTENIDKDINIKFINDDLFTHDFDVTDFKNKRILILGNLPWVTNTSQSITGSVNVPEKKNIMHLRGMDALTGKSNFDVSESMIYTLVKTFKGHDATLSLLCKDKVAQNVVRSVNLLELQINDMETVIIDAKQEFNVAINAVLFYARLNSSSSATCMVKRGFNNNRYNQVFGWEGSQFVANIENYRTTKFVEGTCQFEWRQGVKTDAQKVMILNAREKGQLFNGFDEPVNIERDILFPFVKGSDIRACFTLSHDVHRFVILTQHSLNEDTSNIKEFYPLAWQYLTAHASVLDGRKSRVYKNKPRFSIFGIGEYSFKPYKIGIAGLYKEPVFSFIPPVGSKPVMCDDTSYFLSFDEEGIARLVHNLLNSSDVTRFLGAITFTNNKRVFTKEILMRIDLETLFAQYIASGLGDGDEGDSIIPIKPPVSREIVESLKQQFHAQKRQGLK